jgi:chaperone required for assembly of F1-ATPase
MRRFYRQAAALRHEDGTFGIALDGKPLPTPARRPYALPTLSLAEAIAAEWAAQDKEIKPSTMPLTTLAATALDRIGERREAVIDDITGFARTDLVCYRAERPEPLAERQAAEWQPLLDWLQHRYDVGLAVTTGVVAVGQQDGSIDRLRTVVAALGDFELAAMHALTLSLGSLVIALALLQNEIDEEAAFRRSQLDELFQVERWGEDDEALRRREGLRQDIAACTRFLRLLA